MRRRTGFAATAAAALALLFAQPALAQLEEPDHPTFGLTLMSGSGMITTPYAMVRPGIWGSAVAVAPEGFQPNSTVPADDYTVTRMQGGIGLSDWLEVGATIHGDAIGAFGKAHLFRQQGPFPSIAVGLQNLVTEGRGRFGIEDPFYDDIEDAATLYAVLTYVVGPGGRDFPSWVMFSAGWGTGLFLKDNPQIEDEGGPRGIFGSVAFDFQAAENSYVRVMAEYDGFDVNLGVQGHVWGLEATVGVLSANRDSDPPPPPDPGDAVDPTQTFAGSFYNQLKPFFTLSVNLGDLGTWPWIFTGREEE